MTSPHESNSHSAAAEDDNTLARIALYSLTRARTTFSNLSHLPTWTNADTSSFDCMHYDGNLALEHCASKLDLKPSQHILDIGSGFSATGRFLVDKYHVTVTGIELQRDVHELALAICERNVEREVVEGVRSVNADFLTLEPSVLGAGDGKYDHAVSFLCVTHMGKAERGQMFRQAGRVLKGGGKIYVEDFYRRGGLKGEEEGLLRDVVACPWLPGREEYVADVADAGFRDVEFEDVSEYWTSFLVARAEVYKRGEECSVDLERFYDTVAELFVGGNVGGVRLTAVKA